MYMDLVKEFVTSTAHRIYQTFINTEIEDQNAISYYYKRLFGEMLQEEWMIFQRSDAESKRIFMILVKLVAF